MYHGFAPLRLSTTGEGDIDRIRMSFLQMAGLNGAWDHIHFLYNSESQPGSPGARGLPARAPLSTLNGEMSALAAEAACVPADDRILCR